MNRHSSHARALAIVLALTTGLALNGCAPEQAASPGNTPPDQGQTVEQPKVEEPAGGVNLPADFPSEIPLLPYEVTFAQKQGDGTWRVRMTGSDVDKDGATAQQQLGAAGFTEVTWTENPGKGINGILESEQYQVALQFVRDGDGEVLLTYSVYAL